MAEKRLTGTARKLRREMTDAERVLWSHLRGGQMVARFTRQFPVGGYVVDFACRSLRIAIECDGGQHSVEADAARTASIEAHGYRIIRFWNHEIMSYTDGVLETIAREIEIARTTNPSPRGGELVSSIEEKSVRMGIKRQSNHNDKHRHRECSPVEKLRISM